MEYSEPICVPYRGIGGPAADEITDGGRRETLLVCLPEQHPRVNSPRAPEDEGHQMAGTTAT